MSQVRIVANESVCVGCHLCEVHCLTEQSRSRHIVKAHKREKPRALARVHVEEDRPVSLAIRGNELLVANVKGSQIEIYDRANGKFKGTFGAKGVEQGQLGGVFGISVDKAGNVAPVDVAVESVSGDVRLEQVEGNITLKTVSGDSSALHLAASTLQCKAISGDVTLQLDAPFSGTLSCTTVSGQVRIAVPAGSNFRYTLDTQSGDITCGVEARETSSTETLRNGVVGTGAGTVSVQTLSGDIALVPRDDA